MLSSDATNQNHKPNELSHEISWKRIKVENLNCKYGMIFKKKETDRLFNMLEQSVEYYTGSLSKVCIFGKWHNIPRQQCAFGDEGLTYKFSGNTLPAQPWIPVLLEIKQRVEQLCNTKFNFVLVNRYANGSDHMGEHRDDESDLVDRAPIASFSLGQERDFIFKHKDARGPNKTHPDLPPITISLQNGSLLLMEWPTNVFWYHSLPVRKRANKIRINLTFRCMKK